MRQKGISHGTCPELRLP
jgi:hypothetical protein